MRMLELFFVKQRHVAKLFIFTWSSANLVPLLKNNAVVVGWDECKSFIVQRLGVYLKTLRTLSEYKSTSSVVEITLNRQLIEEYNYSNFYHIIQGMRNHPLINSSRSLH